MWLFSSLLTSIPSNMCSPEMWQAFVEQAENSYSINWQKIKHQDSMLSCLLQNAIAEKNIKVAELLLQNSADVDTKNERGQTLLYGEVNKANNLEIVKLLVRYGADVNAIDNYGIPVIDRAVVSRDIDIIRFLIDNGADIESAESPDKGSQYGAKVNARDFSRPNPFKNPLAKAIDLRNIEAIKLLITNGADVDTTTRRADNPLMLAILEQDREIVQLLLDLGADPWYLEPENIKGYLLSKPTFFRTDIPIFLRNNQFRIKKNR